METLPKQASDVMGIEEVLKATGVSRRTIYKRIADGELHPVPRLPAFKKRGRVLFYRADIDRITQPKESA